MFLRTHRSPRRRGSIIPMMAVCVTVLFGFVALAIDLGMLVIARSAAQDAADTAALTGARTLDNRVPSGTLSDNYDNQSGQALINAQTSVTANNGENASPLTVASSKIGIYDYDTSSQVFRPSYPGTKPSGKAWTAVSVDVTSTQPAYFSRIFGVTSMPVTAHAVAAHRPRDIAVVLDMTGSMKFSSNPSWPEPGNGVVQGLMNPDPNYPQFGHYQRYPTSTMPNAFYRTTYFLQSSQEVLSPNNMTMDGAVGPAIVRQFVFDPSNLSNPATPVPTVSSAAALKNAFHKWNPPGMAPLTTNAEFGPMSSPTGYSGYNAFDTTNSSGPTPAPDTFATQADGAAYYVGDRYPRRAGKYLRDTTSWDPTTTTGAAKTAWDLLFPTSVGTTAPTLSALRTGLTARTNATAVTPDARVKAVTPAAQYVQRDGGTASDWSDFLDAAWEALGYDLDVWAYTQAAGASSTTTDRGTANVKARALDSTSTYPTNGRFQGYSMGPAYYGKTFFMWPPDPRWGNPSGGTPLGTGVRPDQVLATTTPASADASKMVKDSSGNWICDWRRRFFLRSDSATTGAVNADTDTTTQTGSFRYFNPEGDNDPSAAGTQSINQAMLNSGTGAVLRPTGLKVNYPAVLAWIKSGPQVFPPNLRAGHIKYYASIPDNVDNAGSPGSTEAYLDQRFWREYIDFVLGYTTNNSNYDPRYTLAGVETGTWASAGVSIGATANAPNYTVGVTSYTNPKPYMNYKDIPNRPRMHFWFGPASMVAFLSTRLGSGSDRNFNAGTLAEAQTWQLKAGVRSALDDIKNNHPNDQVGSCYFAGGDYTTPRVAMGQDFDSLKAALYYPKSLVAGIVNNTAPNAEKRPYNSSFTEALVGDLPNANDGTDPVSGFAMAYNLCSSATSISGTGRRGATKIVIFETDGVPNSYRTFNFTAGGANSYYTATGSYTGAGNGDPTSISQALAVVDQIVAPTASNGFSLANSPARVYPIAFGDLFSSTSSSKAGALSFLQEVAHHGNTNDSDTTALPSYQIIVGTADERIAGLKTTFERILQSGVQVTLIE